MEGFRKMPIGIQSFEKLRTENYLYVDKTEYVAKLTAVANPYFLSRPRRFGKSLFLSTLKAYFQGKKELFEGLAIAELEKDWIEYPVFHLDMSVGKVTDMASLMSVLETNLQRLEREWGENLREKTPAARLTGLIERAHEQTGRKVVVLVDEYDKPLLDTIDNEELYKLIHDQLGGFYGVLKSTDEHLRLVFLTGITKFAQLNVFSQLNQLDDISLQDAYASICGITEEELLHNFQPELHALAEKNKQTYEEAVAEMKTRYDGYHFGSESPDIYNPFSVLNVLNTKKYRNYWFKTGTPTALVKLVKKQGLSASKLEQGIRATESDIEDFRIGQDNLTPLLYQSGYLTIKEYDPEFEEYRLGFPNKEVMYGFYDNLLLQYAPTSESSDFTPAAFLKELYAGNIDAFMTRIRALFASIPYSSDKDGVRNEDFYLSVFYLLFSLWGQYAEIEKRSARGRADLVVFRPDTVYVFEFKMMNNGTAEDALEQINDKGYAIPYSAGNRKVVKVGAEFSAEERTVSRWVIEE
jgi:hypothetical protein